jgi:hypothetical protein
MIKLLLLKGDNFMQEYDADIKFHFIDFENDKGMEVTSDVDDDFEYFSVYERLYIIQNLLKSIFKQIYDGIEYEEEDSEDFDKKIREAQEVRDVIIQMVLNFQYNTFADILDREKYLIEFATIIYKTINTNMTSVFGPFNMMINTCYSDNICGTDPLNGSAALILDVADAFLEDGMDKEKVKYIINDSMTKQLDTINEFIDNWKKED